jgi:regulatory protein
LQDDGRQDPSADADVPEDVSSRRGGSRWGTRAVAPLRDAADSHETVSGLHRPLRMRNAPEATALSATDLDLLQQVRPASEWLEKPRTGRDRPDRDRSERDRPGRERTDPEPADPERRRQAAPAAAGLGTRTRSSPSAARPPLSSTAPEPEHSAAEASAYSRTSDRARRPSASRARRSAGRSREAMSEQDACAEHDSGAPDAAADNRASRGPGLSLKARAVGFLSRREHSRHELGRKLARYSEDPDEIATVLDSLQRDNWLSDERFATSLIHRRAGRQGASRIVQELRQHGVAAEAVSEMRNTLRATEFERAQSVWRRRYGQPPASPAERARQQRFLAARGFEHDVIRRVVGPVVGGDASVGAGDDE